MGAFFALRAGGQSSLSWYAAHMRQHGWVQALTLAAGFGLAAAFGAPAVLAAPGSPVAITAPAHCSFRQLGISARTAGAGAGHYGLVLLFRNHSRRACTLHGYPGVEALNRHGKPNMEAKRTKSGYLMGDFRRGRPPTVVLRPGRVASAGVEGTDVPRGNHHSCPKAKALRVTPPNDRKARLVHKGLLECSRIQVHPVVHGTTGSTR